MCAIDGTHIPLIVPEKASKRYRNRKGYTSMNVLAGVNLEGKFVFAFAGMEGIIVFCSIMCLCFVCRVVTFATILSQFYSPLVVVELENQLQQLRSCARQHGTAQRVSPERHQASAAIVHAR